MRWTRVSLESACIGLCEVHWKNYGEISTEVGHRLYCSGEENKHEHGVGFLVHKNIKNAVMVCRPISCRAAPLNITVMQTYASKTDCDDDHMEDFYNQLQGMV